MVCRNLTFGFAATVLAVGLASAPAMAETRYNFSSQPWSLAKKFHKQEVSYSSKEAPGTIIISTRKRYLYYVLGNGRALRYGIGVGRAGFKWSGVERITRPNVIGFWGFLQPFADGLKLVLKEMIIPLKAHVFIFLAAPVITLALSLVSWSIIPVSLKANYSDVNLSLLLLFALTSLGVYGIILAGWSSNSKYAFLGGIRSAAQMISYEVSMGFIFIMVAMLSGSLNLIDIVLKQSDVWFVLPLFPLALIFLVIMLAETNRTPFDLPEAEAELVAGYNVEYSSIAFAMFFLGEYSSMLAISSLFVILFLGGWLPPFMLFYDILPSSLIFATKVAFVAFFFVWVRSTLPRYRYDQLMSLGWKKFLPITLGFLLLFIGVIYVTGKPTPSSEFPTYFYHGVESYIHTPRRVGAAVPHLGFGPQEYYTPNPRVFAKAPSVSDLFFNKPFKTNEGSDIVAF